MGMLRHAVLADEELLGAVSVRPPRSQLGALWHSPWKRVATSVQIDGFCKQHCSSDHGATRENSSQRIGSSCVEQDLVAHAKQQRKNLRHVNLHVMNGAVVCKKELPFDHQNGPVVPVANKKLGWHKPSVTGEKL